MSTENYLDQAKGFLSRNAHRLALRAVPLALLTVTAVQAGPVTAVFGAPTGSFGSCSGGAHSGTATGSVINGGGGLTLSGSGTANPGPFGGDCASLHWTGAGSGTFSSATLPASWDFTVTGAPGTTLVGWNLDFDINLGLSTVQTSFSFGGSTGGEFTGVNQPVNVPNGQAFVAYSILLRVSMTGGASPGDIGVSVPAATSIDLNPGVQTAGVPEPSVWLLTAGGLGILVLARIRARGKGTTPPTSA